MTTTSVHLVSAREAGLEPDLHLAATLFLPPAAGLTPLSRLPGLVVGHGAGSRASRHIDFCLSACREGFAVLAPDFRGHGDSHGDADGPLEQDVLAATRFLRDHPAVDADHICYRGSSMGGFYGLKAASEACFAAMVLICPASEAVMLAALDEALVKSEGDTEAPASEDSPAPAATRWDRPGLRAYFQGQDSRALAARVQCPVLLVHVRSDDQVPFAHSLELMEHLRADATLIALEKGSHSSAQHDTDVHHWSLAWLQTQMRRASAQGV